MDYDSYLSMQCIWRAKLAEDPDTLLSTYDEPTVLKCFKYGSNVFERNQRSEAIVNEQTYILNKRVNTGDLIDDQVVRSVYEIPDFDGHIQLYRVLTWSDSAGL